MLSNDAIAMNIYTSFCSMSPKELFETWRNLTDTLGGDFPVVYNKTEFDELIERMPEEELAKLVEKLADFNENDLYFSICDGQLYSTSHLTIEFEPIGEDRCDRLSDLLAEKKLTLGSKRLEEAFTEDFDEDMDTLEDELYRSIGSEFSIKGEFVDENDWEKYVEGCKKVGYDGKNGPFPMEESDYRLNEFEDEDGYYTNDVNSHFSPQDEWFYYNKHYKQYFSFTHWSWIVFTELGCEEYVPDLVDYIVQTDDDLGVARIREILDKNKKYGYAPQKDANKGYY